MAQYLVQVFDNPAFGSIRTLNVEGKVLFCGRDVATALGYVNTKDALAKHCKGVAKCSPPLQTPGGVQQVRFITEGDLYRLIISSKLPTAAKFESWVFVEAAPKVSYYDIMLQSSSLLTVTEIAKDYGLSAKRLNALLRAEGVQFILRNTFSLKLRSTQAAAIAAQRSSTASPDSSIKNEDRL